MSKKIVHTAIALLAFACLNAQNVGIDENSPGSKFSVKGNLSVGPDYSNQPAPANGAIIEGQLGIGTTSPDTSAILDMESSSKGILIPRISTSSRTAIANPATGLLVFDTTAGAFYYFNGTVWVQLSAAGSTGPTGPAGATGANGATWYTATGAPATTLGNIGDFYINSNNGKFYEKTASATWTAEGNLSGSNGAAGATGATGSAGTNGVDGTNGSNGPTGATGTAGTNGSNGATGATGTAGTNGTNGATGPTGATGAAGTNGTNGTNGTTGATGATGANGTAGTNGSNGATGATGLTGAGYTATSTSSVTIGTGSQTFTTQAGLAYLTNDRVRVSNTATNYMDGAVTSYSGTTLVVNVDYKTGSGAFSSWNIGIAGNEGTVGATGSAGINGVDGTNGSNGSTGATGATGAAGAGYYATSTTSLAIASSGNITVTTQSGLAYAPGDRVRVIYQTTTSDYMEGTITSYSSTSMVIALSNSSGSGTFASWYISETGNVGATGTNGTNGATGATGATGPTGSTGTAGTNGTNGATGAAGATGTAGSAGATGAAGAGYYATSTTSVAIASSGNITLTTQSGLAYVPGDRVRVIYQTVTSDYMEGTVTSYSTTSMVIALSNSSGSGTFALWYISETGNVGATGTAGTNGTNGTTGSAGATGATGPTGFLSSGSSAGNTPYWNGSSWIVGSSNIYNNGANVGIGNTSPTSLLSVGSTSQFQVTSAGNAILSPLAGTGVRSVYSDPNGQLINDPNLPATAAPSAPITDNGCGTNTATSSTITLSGLTTSLAATNITVTINITHPADNQVRVDLYSPTGAILNLVNTGQTGANFTNTVFSDAGSTTFPTGGTAPYTGTFKPFGTTSSICSNTPTVTTFAGMGTINPNGTWTLKVYDATSGSTGTLNSWSINISNLYGTDNYLPKWTSSGLSSTSDVYDNGTSVGISTTAPLSALDVNGGMAVGTYAATVAAPSGGFIVSGYAGYGTSNPLRPLSLVGNLAVHGVMYVENTNSASYSAIDYFDNTGTQQANMGYANTSAPSFAGAYYLQTNTTAAIALAVDNVEAMRIINGGNVGIGTTTPADNLQVNDGNVGISNDDNTAGTLKFYEPSTSGANYMAFKAQAMTANVTYTLPAADGSNGQVLSTNGTGTLSWATAGGSTGYILNQTTPQSSSNFDISGNGVVGGSVGIGTSTFTYNLSLSGDAAQTIGMVQTTGSTIGYNLTLQAGGASATGNRAGGDLYLSSGISSGSGTSNMHFLTTTAGSPGNTLNTPTEQMTILGSGNVGVNNTAPLSLFEVDGSFGAKITTVTNTATSVDATATVWYFNGTASITLPTASTCANRMYFIVNRTTSLKTISSFTNLAGTATTSVAASTGIIIISNGTSWLQLQ